MAKGKIQRKLSAILCADVVGYSRLMGEDEAATLHTLKRCVAQIIEPTVKEHRGRIFKRLGDGFMVEFSSAVDSVECALDWQRRVDSAEPSLSFRIGINLGEVIPEPLCIYRVLTESGTALPAIHVFFHIRRTAGGKNFFHRSFKRIVFGTSEHRF